MRKTVILLAAATLLAACQQGKKAEDSKGNDSTAIDSTAIDSVATTSSTPKTFDIESIPVSSADIGQFPYFTLPEGLVTQNKPLERKFDVCFFPINGTMTPKEGKLWKSYIVAAPGQEFSQRYFEKSFDDYLAQIGGVKIFDGHITKTEEDRYIKDDPNKGDEGDIGYANENIKVYVIRTAKEGNIYVQLSANNASGKLNILQEKGLTQTIQKVTAEDIAKDLTAKGKSILYINFDVDKSTVTDDGKAIVDQIAQALKTESTLKIKIEGHTDNTGDAAHNKKLSNDRANVVRQQLEKSGIAAARLSAQGYGAERPLVANDNEENKAKNRRVELIKVN